MAERVPMLPDDSALHLRTERLQLVPINRSHAPVMFDILNDESLYEFTGGKPPSDVATLEKRFIGWESRVAPDGSELWLNWVLHETRRDEIIGHVQAGVGHDHADVAWVIGSRWQGRGYASEAARSLVEWLATLGIAEIRASVGPDHAASNRVAERAGLRRSDEVRDDGEVVWRRSAALAR